jgi:hypothetical protein
VRDARDAGADYVVIGSEFEHAGARGLRDTMRAFARAAGGTA